MTETGNQAAPVDQQIDILRQRLAEAQRMTALGELVSTTTHEFNNVLMTILNYAKMGLRNDDKETRDKAFAKILTAGERAAKITNTVLGMARNRGVSLEPTDLVALLEETMVLMEREMRKYRISVETYFEPLPLALASGNQIQQVLLNLMTNSRQAMPDGGLLQIKLSHDSADNAIVLQLRDNGCGMTPETMQRIFDPFYTTKSGPDSSGKGGTGIGLSACRDIIEAHRGRIRVESTPGKGTAFIIRLQVATPAAPASPVVAVPNPVAAGSAASAPLP